MSPGNQSEWSHYTKLDPAHRSFQKLDDVMELTETERQAMRDKSDQ